MNDDVAVSIIETEFKFIRPCANSFLNIVYGAECHRQQQYMPQELLRRDSVWYRFAHGFKVFLYAVLCSIGEEFKRSEKLLGAISKPWYLDQKCDFNK